MDKTQITLHACVKYARKKVGLRFNLVPLRLRRDIAVLGFLHKCALQKVHPALQRLFPLDARRQIGRHDKQLRSNAEVIPQVTPLYRRSIVNMIHVYNLLSQRFVDKDNVQDFQHLLTHMAKIKCVGKLANWRSFLSAREVLMQNLLYNPLYRIL